MQPIDFSSKTLSMAPALIHMACFDNLTYNGAQTDRFGCQSPAPSPGPAMDTDMITQPCHPTPRPAQGFSFIELSVALVVMGILISIGFTLMDDVLKSSKRKQAIDQMEEIKEAIEGFAVANNRLPCPDDNSDGAEDLTSNTCDADSTNDSNALPYTTLGLPTNQDPWGNVIQYAVYNRSSGTGNRTNDFGSDQNSTGGTTRSRNDFCTKLTTALTGALATGTDIHIGRLPDTASGLDSDTDCSSGSKMAFILSSPGGEDADSDTNSGIFTTTGVKFDGNNNPGGQLCFENPKRIVSTLSEKQSATQITNNYDDIVIGGSIASLISRLNCQN